MLMHVWHPFLEECLVAMMVIMNPLLLLNKLDNGFYNVMTLNGGGGTVTSHLAVLLHKQVIITQTVFFLGALILLV